METLMIKIENNAKMTAAIARCRKAHPKVRRISADRVAVIGRKGDTYTVTFATPREDLKLASCTCEAGRKNQVCYHLAAALAAPVAAPATVAPVAPRVRRQRPVDVLIKYFPGKEEVIEGFTI